MHFFRSPSFAGASPQQCPKYFLGRAWYRRGIFPFWGTEEVDLDIQSPRGFHLFLSTFHVSLLVKSLMVEGGRSLRTVYSKMHLIKHVTGCTSRKGEGQTVCFNVITR